MSSDEQFTATGSAGLTLVGFQTRPGARFERGVDATGIATGVVAAGNRGVGVDATGALGVSAEGKDTGVKARATSGTGTAVDADGFIAVRGQGRATGVIGLGKTGVFGNGLKVGLHAEGPVGVQGAGKPGPGGEFSSADKVPQLRLVPQKINAGNAVPLSQVTVFHPSPAQLPAHGRIGDLLLTQTKGSVRAILWVCVAAHTSSSRARWAQVLLGPPIEGATIPGDDPEG
jgi:hypothetical protein